MDFFELLQGHAAVFLLLHMYQFTNVRKQDGGISDVRQMLTSLALIKRMIIMCT